MKLLLRFRESLARRINALISRTEAENPGMQDSAAMVYVGDVYALREIRERRHADGWGQQHYSADDPDGKPLP